MNSQERESLERPKTGQQIMGGLRIFPTMASSGDAARLMGMRKKQAEEASSLFPLPQVPQRTSQSLAVL
jgi:hypothetical protein